MTIVARVELATATIIYQTFTDYEVHYQLHAHFGRVLFDVPALRGRKYSKKHCPTGYGRTPLFKRNHPSGMKYFHIQQKNGRKSVFRVFKTDYRRCEFVKSFPSEDAAKALVKQLIEEERR